MVLLSRLEFTMADLFMLETLRPLIDSLFARASLPRAPAVTPLFELISRGICTLLDLCFID